VQNADKHRALMDAQRKQKKLMIFAGRGVFLLDAPFNG
jgi:hypothetical protein